MPRIGSHVFNLRDFVKETTQTSGTGAYSLDGVSLPEEGHQSFLTAVGDGQKTFYGVKRGSTWEKVIGTISAGAPVTISRDRIMGTSVDDNIDADPIDWPTTDPKDIYIGEPSDVLNLIQGPGQVAWDSVAGGNNALTVDVDPIITAYFDGMTVWFRKGDTTNTASMTLNVNSIGAKPFVKAIGVAMAPGDAAAHALMGAVYVAAEDDFVAVSGLTPEQPLGRGYIDGFTMASAADTDHDITFGIGACRSSSNAANIVLAGALTKRFDATWAVGTGNGGMQSGSSIANNTWYEAYAIKRLDTGVVDVQAVPSGTSLTLPTNYTVSRRIGYFASDGSANIWPFVHHGGERFLWSAPVSSFNSTVGTSSGSLEALRVPPLSRPIFSVSTSNTTELRYLLVSDPAQADSVVSSTVHNVYSPDRDNGAFNTVIFEGMIRSNGAGQVRLRANIALDAQMMTLGWIDTRGRDA